MSDSVLFYASNFFGFSVGAVTFDLLLEEHHELKSKVTEHPVDTGTPISDHVVRELRTGTIKGLVSNYSLNVATELPSTIAGMIGPSVRRYAGALVSTGLAVAAGNVWGTTDTTSRVATAIANGAAVAAADIVSVYPKLDSIKAALATLDVPDNRALDTWTLFKKIWTDGKPVTIITGVERYENYMITEVTTERTSDTGECLEFSVSFTEYRTVTFLNDSVSVKMSPKLTSDNGKKAQPKKALGRRTGTGNTTKASKAVLQVPTKYRMPVTP